jgi:hypothetical protein
MRTFEYRTNIFGTKATVLIDVLENGDIVTDLRLNTFEADNARIRASVHFLNAGGLGSELREYWKNVSRTTDSKNLSR